MLSFIQGIHLVVSLMLLYILLKHYSTLNNFVNKIGTYGCIKTCPLEEEHVR